MNFLATQSEQHIVIYILVVIFTTRGIKYSNYLLCHVPGSFSSSEDNTVP